MLVNTLTLFFENELAPYEVPLFRGAIIHSLEHKLLLFHNHDGDGFRYAYPLIQYKRLEGKAAIMCIKKGVDDAKELLSSPTFPLQMRSRKMEARITAVIPQTFDIHVDTKMHTYRMDYWCALNETNWHRYNEMEGLAERITFLESILTGNILSFAKGIGWHIGQEVKCKILSFDHIHPRNIKGVNMACLGVDFQCNVSLPDHIGLGKHVSINFGVLRRIHSNKQ